MEEVSSQRPTEGRRKGWKAGRVLKLPAGNLLQAWRARRADDSTELQMKDEEKAWHAGHQRSSSKRALLVPGRTPAKLASPMGCLLMGRAGPAQQTRWGRGCWRSGKDQRTTRCIFHMAQNHPAHCMIRNTSLATNKISCLTPQKDLGRTLLKTSLPNIFPLNSKTELEQLGAW